MKFNLILMTIFMVSIEATDKFCVRERKLILAGVFNYENIVFAYSWRDVKEFQQQNVWRFQINNNKLIELGIGLTIEEVFPGIPLFRAGFGLNLKCDGSDTNCEVYNKLVFVFFQTFYKVLRFSNQSFIDEPNATTIPWGLESRGEAKDFGFGNNNIDNIMAAAFVTGYQSQIFIVSKNILYNSPFDLKATALEWTEVTQSPTFNNVLGAFVFGTDIVFNRIESPDGVIMIYDQNGRETNKSTVWKFFGCKSSGEALDSSSKEKSENEATNSYPNLKSEEEINNRYAALIITIIIIAIIISNTSAAVFWLAVSKAQKKDNNLENGV